jgi:hypothetical protein
MELGERRVLVHASWWNDACGELNIDHRPSNSQVADANAPALENWALGVETDKSAKSLLTPPHRPSHDGQALFDFIA